MNRINESCKIDDNNNNSEKEEKESIGIKFTKQKANAEKVIDFRWSDIRGEIAKANLIVSLQKQADEEFFPKE